MEKPVRIIENEKIRTFNGKVSHGLEHALNFMLGTDENSHIRISGFEPFLMPIEAYLAAYKKKSVMIKIHASNAFTGELYWFFELKTAIVLGSLLRMMPYAALEERLKQETLDATDQDSFGEVGNQLCGILDRAFRTLTKKNIHLRMDFEKKLYPNESIQLSSFRNEEEYVVLLCSITFPKHGHQKLTLLLPRSLYEVLLNLEIQLEGITPKLVLLHTWDEEKAEYLQSKLNSRYTKVIYFPQPDELLLKIDSPNVCAVGLDFKSVPIPLGMQENIFFKRLAANRALGKMPYFLSFGSPTAETAKQLTDLGLKGTTLQDMKTDFPKWVHEHTKDPSA